MPAYSVSNEALLDTGHLRDREGRIWRNADLAEDVIVGPLDLARPTRGRLPERLRVQNLTLNLWEFAHFPAWLKVEGRLDLYDTPHHDLVWPRRLRVDGEMKIRSNLLAQLVEETNVEEMILEIGGDLRIVTSESWEAAGLEANGILEGAFEALCRLRPKVRGRILLQKGESGPIKIDAATGELLAEAAPVEEWTAPKAREP